MAGKKGRSGGARTPRDPANAKKRGPLITSGFTLDKETAREIKILIMAAGKPYTGENVAVQIAAWSRAAWDEYERPILAAAEEEGLIL